MNEHLCHEPRCTKPVPPEKLACSQHWFALPIGLRRAIWMHYQPGQEITKDPSPEYIETALACVDEWDQQEVQRNAEVQRLIALADRGIRDVTS